MNVKENLWNILRTEYGISSVQELNDAIKKQKRIDISIFCSEPEKRKEEMTA